MDRRRFLKTTTGVATVAATGSVLSKGPASALSAPARSGQHYRLRAGLAGANNGQGLSDTFGQFAALVHDLSDGKVTFDVGENEPDALASCRTGAVEAFCGSAHDLTTIATAFAFFAGLPGRLNISGPELDRWLSESAGQTLWTRLGADFNLRALMIGDGGPQSLMLSKVSLSRESQLATKTIVTHGLAKDVAAGIGARFVEKQPGPALQSQFRDSAVDLIELGGMTGAVANGVLRGAKFAATPGIYRHSGPDVVVFNRNVWAQLPADIRRMIKSAAATAFQDSVAFQTTQHDVMRGAAARQTGLQFVALPKQLRDTIDGVSDSVVAHVAGGSAMARRINASFITFAKARRLV